MKRRKLFSSTSNSPIRRKLFSSVPVEKQFICMDCGYVINTAESSSKLFCPKCGGTRFNLYSNTESVPSTEEKNFTRRSLFTDEEFEKEFSIASNSFDKNLKQFSGKTISNYDVEKLFSTTTDDLVEKGFAEKTDAGVKILDTAFLQSKLFSKLIVSVTKILDLDPKAVCDRTSAIKSLAEENTMSPKGIILIKKAHSLPMLSENELEHCDNCEMNSWAKDSGINGDLKLEFGGKDMDLENFTSMLRDRYSDAPKGLINYLISNGLIDIQGNKVNILN